MRHGIVNAKTGKVVNIILWEGASFLPPAGHYVVRHDEIDVDDDYDITTTTLNKRNKTQRDVNNDSIASLEAEIEVKKRELEILKSQL